MFPLSSKTEVLIMKMVSLSLAVLALVCTHAAAEDASPVLVKKLKIVVEIKDGDKDTGADLVFRLYNPDDGEVEKLSLNPRQKATRFADESTHELVGDWKAKPISVRDLRTAGYSVNLQQVGRSNPHVRLRYSVEVLGSDNAWYTVLSATDPNRPDYNFPPGNPDRIDVEENESKAVPSRQVTEKVKLK